jgi:superfamily I DNA/RNA helicase
VKKVILSGGTGTGKTTRLMKEYERLINERVLKSEEILILLMNRNQSLEWRKQSNFSVSGRIFRTSFFGFVQEEISTYYSIILKNVPEIKSLSVKPVFLTFETSQYLLSMLIEKRRNKEDSFLNLIDKDSGIAIDISSNFVKAAAASLSYKDIGDRLYSALEIKTPEKKAIFEEADRIIEDYRKRCLECGVMDFAMAIDFYNNILLKDNEYLASLRSRIKYLIVDNLEEAVPMQVDLIETLITSVVYENLAKWSFIYRITFSVSVPNVVIRPNTTSPDVMLMRIPPFISCC